MLNTIFKWKNGKDFIFIVCVIILTNIWVRGPDLWLWRNTPDSVYFTGQSSWVDHVDLNLYFRVIRMGAEQGFWSIYNIADSLGTDKAVIYPFYTLIGIIAGWFDIDPVLAFHLAGVITSSILIVFSYWFLGLFIDSSVWRKIGLLWLYGVGGIGWFLYPHTILPDIGVPIFTFWSALRSPHDALTIIGILGFLGYGFLSITTNQSKWLLWFGVMSALVLLNHPEMMVPLLLILGGPGIYICFKQKQYHQLFKLMSVFVVVFGVYYLYVGSGLLFSSMSAELRTQDTYIFSPWYWIGGWGLIGVMGLYWLWTQRNTVFISNKRIFVCWWFCVQLIVFYFPPLPYRGLMVRGLWMAIILMAIWGSERLAKKFRLKPWLVGMCLFGLSAGDLIFIFEQRISARHLPQAIYISRSEYDIVQYLDVHGSYDEGVLGSYRFSNLVMGLTRLRPYVGHFILTPHSKERLYETMMFYRGSMSDGVARDWLRKSNIQWILMGKEEQQMAGTQTLPYPWLREIITTDEAKLYVFLD